MAKIEIDLKQIDKIKQILGVKGAEKCLEEIKERRHPEDTHEFRKALIKDIVKRHVRKKNLRISDIQDLMCENEKTYCRRLIHNLADIIIDEMHEKTTGKDN